MRFKGAQQPNYLLQGRSKTRPTLPFFGNFSIFITNSYRAQVAKTSFKTFNDRFVGEGIIFGTSIRIPKGTRMYLPQPDPSSIAKTIAAYSDSKESDLWLLFLAEEDHDKAESIRQFLMDSGLHFIGGMFPRVVHGANSHTSGLVIKRLPGGCAPIVVRNLSSGTRSVPENKIKEIEAMNGLTALVLVDGLAPNINGFLDSLFNDLGHSVNYIGGGAGSISLEPKPCLISEVGILEDAAVIAFIDAPTCLGVRHGWQKIYGPLVATSTKANVIQKLNWGNAFDTYREVVESHTGKALNANAFFETSKGFPFGMTKANAEAVVRDPIAVNSIGELICVGEVPENTVINVLEGKPESLIAAAEQALEDCQTNDLGIARDCLMFDSISRALFLEEDFEKELATVQHHLPHADPPLVNEGALTLGEISSNGQGFLEFFNKTIVMGLVYEKTGAAS